MKIRFIIFSALLICNGQIAVADALSRTRNTEVRSETKNAGTGRTGFFKKITPEMLYGYTDFNFNSTKTGNFNRFKGHSNLYSVGADHLSLSPSVTAGIYYFRIDTALASEFSFSPNPVAVSDQTIENNTIFGHVLKVFTPQIYVDVAGGYGYNQLH